MQATQRNKVAVLLLVIFCFGSVGSLAHSDELAEQLMQKLDQQQQELDALRRQVEALHANQKEATAVAVASTVPVPASTEDEQSTPWVVSSTNGVNVKLSGRVHRMLQYVDDGIDKDVFHTDSDQGPTMLRVDAEKVVDDGLKLGTTIELGLQQNRPLLVSQDDREKSLEVTGRIAEVYVDSSKFGKASFGRGFMSSWYVPETDLSGTQFVSLLSPGMLFGGLRFADPDTGEYTDTKVSNYFFDTERFLLKDRVRYDSIRYGGHTSVGGSIASDEGWDVTLRTMHKPGDFRIVAASSFQKDPFLDIDQRWDAAIATRHEPTGLNFAIGGFVSDTRDNRDPDSYVVKLGWLTNFVDSGSTAFSLDWSESRDVEVDGDSAESWGMFVMQSWDAYNLKIHAGIRRYDIDAPGEKHEPITIIPIGVLMSF